jgi:Protein of unknown function/AsmA-like C-terminal region
LTGDKDTMIQDGELPAEAGQAEAPCPISRARIARVMGVPSRVGPFRKRRKRWLRALLGVGVLLALLCGALGYALFTLQSERNSAFLRERFTDLVTKALGPGHELELQSAGMEFAGVSPKFTLGGLVVRNTHTKGEARLAQASFALSPLSLWRLSPEARVVTFSDLKLILPDSGANTATLRADEVLALLRGTLGTVHIAISGEEAAFSALKSVEGTDISLFRRVPNNGIVPLQNGLGLSIARSGSGNFTATIRKPGVESLTMNAAALKENGVQSVVLDTGDIRAGTLFTLIGERIAGVDPALNISVRLASRMGGDRQLAESSVSLRARGGRIELPDPDMVPFVLDEGLLEFKVKPGQPELEVSRLLVRFNETDIEASGTLTPLPASGGLAVRLRTDKALLDRLSPGEEVVQLDSAEMEGELSADFGSFRLDRLDIAEDEGRARLSGRFSILGEGLIETKLDGGGFLLRKALRIWPIWVAPNVRSWLVDHLKGGRLASISLSTHLEGEALRNAFAKKPVPDEALSLAFRIEDAEIAPMSDALPLKGANANGVVSGRRAQFVIEEGRVETPNGRVIALGPSRLVVADTARKPALLEMTLPAKGRLDALMTFLRAPSLSAVTGLPTDLAVAEGVFDGTAQILVPLGEKTQPKDTKIDIKGDLKGVVVENVIKGEKLENGNLTMVSKAGVVSVKGDARLFGAPAQVEFKVEPRGAIAQVKMSLDDAALARRGIDLRPSVSGVLGVTASLALGKADAPVEFDIDLARAKIAASVPGITKAAGQAGRAKFQLRSGETSQQIEALELDFGSLSLRGKLDLAKDGGFNRAELSSFKLSGGDNVRLSVERVGKVQKMVLRGNSFDVRPFLKGLQSGRIEDSTNSVDFDLDLNTTVLVGFGGELMGGAELKLSRRGGHATEVNLKGQFSGAPVRITSTPQGRSLALKVSSGDGGSLARFLDLYSRAYGGQLSGEIALSPNGGQEGVVQMRDFYLRGEAGLRSVSPNARDGQAVIRGTDDVPFTKLRADFTRKPGRLEVREAVMWGPQVGGTMEGVLDYAGDSVSMKGTFVPAYALNNLFAQVPILGPILGGGQYEGLFAVPFLITGKASAPTLRVNPVSAIAPGFLRKIFEIRKESQ